MPRKSTVPDKVYNFIATWKEEHDGNSPTYDEISEHFGWGNPSTAWWAVDKLERMGKVRFDKNRKILLGGEYIPPQA